MFSHVGNNNLKDKEGGSSGPAEFQGYLLICFEIKYAYGAGKFETYKGLIL